MYIKSMCISPSMRRYDRVIKPCICIESIKYKLTNVWNSSSRENLRNKILSIVFSFVDVIVWIACIDIIICILSCYVSGIVCKRRIVILMYEIPFFFRVGRKILFRSELFIYRYSIFESKSFSENF